MQRGRGHALALALVLHACGDDGPPTVQVTMSRDECTGQRSRVLCSSGGAITCTDGAISGRVFCRAPQSCVDEVGCRVCKPGKSSCDGNQRYVCNADGSGRAPVEQCGAGLSCSAAGCVDLCSEAAKNRSYLGCDYWPVFTSNSMLDPIFVPAVAVGNGNMVSAHVVITKNQAVVAELDVAANSAQTVPLTFDQALKDSGGSRLVRQGAYHLTSSVPVTVHQYNPLLYQLQQTCADPSDVKEMLNDYCYSYTNDASLLFPSTALLQDPDNRTGAFLEFVAISRSTFMKRKDDPSATPPYRGTPGFVAVVAVGASPTTVTFKSSAYTLPSPAQVQDDVIEPLSPNGMLQRTLSPGDVLQLVSQVPSACSGMQSNDGTYCDPGAELDLTGSQISADGPVQVISGHDCTNVPFDRTACDHLEESVPPLHAWGNNAIVTVPQATAGGEYILRVLSGDDANTVTFDPPVHEPVTLAKNQLVEFDARVSIVVQGTGRLLVGQYLVGENRSETHVGDPSLSLSVPVEQYRSSYNFISPGTYQRNYIDIIALSNDIVTLDGQIITTFTQVGSSGFSAASVVLQRAGAHEVHGFSPIGIGIVLYGVASYTSYMLPGGLDLQPIGPIGI